jgi:diketogulonate reductase-like aldo/keto reductase
MCAFVSWCAAKYQNEAEVGDALEEAFETGLVKRGDLFITTKVIRITKAMLSSLSLFFFEKKRVHKTVDYMLLEPVKRGFKVYIAKDKGHSNS